MTIREQYLQLIERKNNALHFARWDELDAVHEEIRALFDTMPFVVSVWYAQQPYLCRMVAEEGKFYAGFGICLWEVEPTPKGQIYILVREI